LAFAEANLAMLSVRAGDVDAVRLHLVAGLELAQELGLQQAAAGALESSAELASLRDEPHKAASLLGAAVALRDAAGMPAEPGQLRELDKVRAWARTRLGEDGFAEASREGGAWSSAEAVAQTLEWLRGTPASSKASGAALPS